MPSLLFALMRHGACESATDADPAIVSHRGPLSRASFPALYTTPLPPHGFHAPSYAFPSPDLFLSALRFGQSQPSFVFSPSGPLQSSLLHHQLLGFSTPSPFIKQKFAHEENILQTLHHSKPLHGFSPRICNREPPPKCSYNTTKPWCNVDHYYPLFDIEADLHYHRRGVAGLYADVANLDTTNSVVGPLKLIDETYLCPSQTNYIRPLRAQDIKGTWRIIVNGVKIDNEHLTQTVRMEECHHHGLPCPLLPHCYSSTCLQKSTFQRFLVYDPCDARFPFATQTFKFPTSCSCRLDDSYVIN
ncbi:hypothetical protein HAZT_HAZT003719 [Hyalella azteca]|uniref:Spaetzle domain-containing protein n=2 Tax=Hyalella azteca TaxID=294128 RepID=A0A6A0GZY0_HYAAZ|nr:hypothetical protein HAZT_HAZT003719 [Hyalella azteca]